MLTGKGMFLWQIRACEGGNPAAIADSAAAAGFEHVLIKIADGAYAYNYDKNNDLVPAVVAALNQVGIEQIWGWHYVYAVDPQREAKIAVQRTKDLGLKGYVINAEVEYKERPSAAVYLADYLQANLDVPIALSSYRFPALHMEFPWRQFFERVDLYMPQVYWIGAHNPGEQLRRSLAQIKVLAPNLPILPTGASFQEHGWRATAGEIAEFSTTARVLGLPGINFWEWGHARRYGLWDAVAGLDWGAELPDPDPDPDPEPVLGLPLKVMCEQLNVRTGPGLHCPDVGDLYAGQMTTARDVAGYDAWVRIGEGRWTCAQQNNSRFMTAMPSESGLKMRVTAGLLNIRSGPGVSYRVVDLLQMGAVVDVLALAGQECWARIQGDPERWACAQLMGTQFLKGV